MTTCAILGLVVGCSDDPSSPGASKTPPSASRATATASAAPRINRGFEDEILKLEAQIPGFGGMFRDAAGRAVIYLRDLPQANAAVGTIRSMAATLNVEPGFARQLAEGRDIEVRRGLFAFSQLVDWQRTVAAATVRLNGFISVDADESLNQVRVTIADDVSPIPFQDAVAALGLPASAVKLETGPRPQLLNNLRDRWRPTEGGMMIMNQNSARCSIGYNVTTYAWNETGFLTASHCAPGSIGAGATGGSMYQSIVTSNDFVGTILLNPAYTRTDPECAGLPCTEADVMFVQYSNTSIPAKRVAATSYVGTNSGAGSIDRIGYWNYIRPVPGQYVGMTADKVGRSTGWTRGTVAGTCEVFNAGNEVVLCSNRVTGMRAGQGDSGSPVFYPLVNPDPLYTMGILFAGSPLNALDQDGFWYCSSNCSVWYTPWENIGPYLSRYFYPY